MAQHVTATPAALDLLERLRAQHGDLIVHVSGGCCDGSSPMCLRASDLPASPHDVQLGALAGVPVVIGRPSGTPVIRPAAGPLRRTGPEHLRAGAHPQPSRQAVGMTPAAFV